MNIGTSKAAIWQIGWNVFTRGDIKGDIDVGNLRGEAAGAGPIAAKFHVVKMRIS